MTSVALLLYPRLQAGTTPDFWLACTL